MWIVEIIKVPDACTVIRYRDINIGLVLLAYHPDALCLYFIRIKFGFGTAFKV